MAARFEENTYVKYASAGVCAVDSITMMAMPGSSVKKEYYVLRPTDNQGSVIYVPAENEAMMANILPLPTKEEIDATIRSVSEEELRWIDDRKERSVVHKEILKRCDRRELIILAGSIYRRRQELAAAGRKLAGTDEATLRQAERLVSNELAFVLGIKADGTGEYIRSLLEEE